MVIGSDIIFDILQHLSTSKIMISSVIMTKKSDTCRIKRSHGVLVIRNEGIKDVWKRYFKSAMNNSMAGKAKVTSIGVKINVGWQ